MSNMEDMARKAWEEYPGHDISAAAAVWDWSKGHPRFQAGSQTVDYCSEWQYFMRGFRAGYNKRGGQCASS